MKKDSEQKTKDYYFGTFSVFIPSIFLIVSIIVLVVLKRASLKTFWIGGIFSIFLMYLLSKDKKEFGTKCVENMKDNSLLTCIMVFLFAGILSSILKVSGISDALLTVFIKFGVGVELLPAIIFVICCVISTFIGTSTGTYSIAVPIFLPLAVSLNCNPALILGAIVCGGYFGDNLSPISDTTLISVNTMHVGLYETLKERLKVSLICAFISTIIYVILGHFLLSNAVTDLESLSGSLKPLIMLSVFVLMIFLLAKKLDLISVLLICDMAAIAVAVVSGLVNVSDMFSKESPIISGIEGVFGVIVFWIILFTISGFIPKKMLEDFIENKVKNSTSVIKTNALTAVSIILSILLVSNNTAAMSLMSKFIDKCFKNKTQIEKANIFDGLSCAVPSLLPYNTAFMLMVTLSKELGCIPENFSVLSIVMFSVNGMLLLLAYIFLALYTPKKRLEKEQKMAE